LGDGLDKATSRPNLMAARNAVSNPDTNSMMETFRKNAGISASDVSKPRIDVLEDASLIAPVRKVPTARAYLFDL
jgi:hypothetical protein